MTRVLVVDDHPVYRRGIASLLAASGYDIVGEAASEAEAVALAERLLPEVVIMDLGLPDGSGVTATGQIVAMHPQIKVVVVTLFDDSGTVREALAAGATAYVVKDADHEEILAAVRAAELGLMALGSGVRSGVSPALEDHQRSDSYGFTARERQIADLLSKGISNRAIAERLGLAGKTVANNVSNILAKLGVADRVAAAIVLRQDR